MTGVPICLPEHPRFANQTERHVWTLLRDQLMDDDVLLAGVRVTDRMKDHEADLVVISPGAGVLIVEVKGGSVWRADGEWWQSRGSSRARIDPVGQARGARYALRAYVEADPRWFANGRRRIRWAHAVVLARSAVGEDFAATDCPRWMVIDRTELNRVGNRLCGILVDQKSNNRLLTHDHARVLVEVLAGRGRAHRDVIADAEDRSSQTQRLTEEQAVILGATRLLNRVEVRGGAGSGKTWLAIEQARRMTRDGKRVAVLCYSRGLAAFLRRHVATLPGEQRPAYVGEFHSLGHALGRRGRTRRRRPGDHQPANRSWAAGSRPPTSTADVNRLLRCPPSAP